MEKDLTVVCMFKISLAEISGYLSLQTPNGQDLGFEAETNFARPAMVQSAIV